MREITLGKDHKFHDNAMNPQRGEQGKMTKEGAKALLKAIDANVTGKKVKAKRVRKQKDK